MFVPYITQKHKYKIELEPNGLWTTYLTPQDKICDSQFNDLVNKINYFYDTGIILIDEIQRKDKNVLSPAYVYRYIDREDGITKYIGIVYGGSSSMYGRVQEHARCEAWVKESDWIIQYFVVRNRAEAEAYESHLIAVYETYRFHNKAKATWGSISFLENIEVSWLDYNENTEKEKYRQIKNYYKPPTQSVIKRIIRNRNIPVGCEGVNKDDKRDVVKHIGNSADTMRRLNRL